MLKEKDYMAKTMKPLTYDEQILKLTNDHKLIITDKDQAINILNHIGYFRLSGYGVGLTIPSNNKIYKDGISIITLYRLHSFDSSLRGIIFHAIEQIELKLRTQLSNYLGLKYGPECYTNEIYFLTKTSKNGMSIHEIILKKFHEECNHHRRAPFVYHYSTKYAGHFPIWVALELFSFGNLTSLFSIMLPIDKKEIASSFKTKHNHLESWLLALVELRNICAHYGRLYNTPLKQMPFLYKEYVQYRLKNNNKVFPVIIVIKKLLSDNQKEWNFFLNNLISIFNEYENVINLYFIGFPDNWKEVLSN